MQRRLNRVEQGKAFLGIQVGRGDDIQGRRVSIVGLDDQGLEKELRTGGDDVVIIDMTRATAAQIRRVNSRREATICVGKKVVLYFANNESYRPFARGAADWNSMANIEIGARKK